MMKPTIKHAISKCGLLVVSSLLLSGCFDLSFPDKQSYYEAFDSYLNAISTDVTGKASSSNNYSIEEYIFNDATVNNMLTAKTLDPNYFEYLSVQASDEMLLNEFGIFIKCLEKVDFVFRVFIVNNLPDASKVRAYNQPNEDPETHKKIPYSDRFENPCVEFYVTALEKEWTSFYTQSWKIEDKNSNTIKINKGQYIICQILNNTGYGADLDLKPVRLVPVNLMILPVVEQKK